MEYSKNTLTKLIKEKALELGFNGIGISKAEKLEGFEESLTGWLNDGFHAQMEYMEHNFEKRIDPTLLVTGAKSVISLIISYYPKKQQPSDIPQISKYAYGIDYHFILKDKMKLLWDYIIKLYHLSIIIQHILYDDTEQEAIFAACEWILNQKDNQCKLIQSK